MQRSNRTRPEQLSATIRSGRGRRPIRFIDRSYRQARFLKIGFPL